MQQCLVTVTLSDVYFTYVILCFVAVPFKIDCAKVMLCYLKGAQVLDFIASILVIFIHESFYAYSPPSIDS